MIQNRYAILAILTALNLINYLDRYLVVGVGTGLQAELGISDGQFGDVATAFMWGYFITSPLFGWLGDRYPRKWLIAGGVAVWSLATALSGLASSYGAMIAARIFVGIGEASYATLSPTIIDDLATKDTKNRWLAIFYVAIPVGSALGFLLGGQLEKFFGWRSAFFIAGGPGVLLALLVLFLREPARRAGESSESSEVEPANAAPAEEKRTAYAELLRRPRYVLTVLGYVGQTFALGGFAAFAVHFLVRKLCFAPDKATLAFGGITVVTGLGGTAFGGWLADRIKGVDRTVVNLRICAWSSLLAAPIALLALLAPSATGFLIALGVCQFVIFASTSPTNAALLDSVPSRLRANAMALSIFAIHLFGDIVSPPLIGRISDAYHDARAMCSPAPGLQLGMLLLPAALVLSGLGWLAGTRTRDDQLPR